VFLALLASGCAGVDLSGATIVPDGGKTVQSGEVVDGDLLVMSGDVEVLRGGQVAGSILAFSGDVFVNGKVAGDVVALSGDLKLGPGAEVEGDATTLSGDLYTDPQAQVTGQTGEGSFTVPEMDIEAPSTSPLHALIWLLIRSLVPAIVAVLIVAIWPRNILRAVRTVTEEPVASGTIGIVAIIFGVPIIALLFITVCLCWAGFLLAAVMLVALFFGWAALGTEIGQRLGVHLGSEWPVPAAAAIGTWILSVILGLIEFVPCIGLLISILVACIALGAAMLSHFGRREYPAVESHEEAA
jgi:hypothetical protein